MLEAREVEAAAVEVVHDAAGRADHDVGTALQPGELRAVALPAVDRQHAHTGDAGRVGRDGLADLQGELAGRCEDEGLRLLPARVEPLQDGQGERGGLAGAGLGEPHHVASVEQRGNGTRLDGRGGLVAEVGQGVDDRRDESEVGEGL